MKNTVHLNITLPSSINDDLNHFAKELNEKKSHIIASALDMYLDNLVLKVAEKRLAEDNGERYTLDEILNELEI
jgi:predicted transcriptional regulator